MLLQRVKLYYQRYFSQLLVMTNVSQEYEIKYTLKGSNLKEHSLALCAEAWMNLQEQYDYRAMMKTVNRATVWSTSVSRIDATVQQSSFSLVKQVFRQPGGDKFSHQYLNLMPFSGWFKTSDEHATCILSYCWILTWERFFLCKDQYFKRIVINWTFGSVFF